MVADDFPVHDIDQGQLEKELLCPGDVAVFYVHFPKLIGSIYLHVFCYAPRVAPLDSTLRPEHS
jgi:hypothetical protein